MVLYCQMSSFVVVAEMLAEILSVGAQYVKKSVGAQGAGNSVNAQGAIRIESAIVSQIQKKLPKVPNISYFRQIIL